jgi:ankyrin repeat protein
VAWSASIVYAQATPALRRLLADDPVLGPELHHIRRIEERWPGGVAPHGLPAGGLLAVPGVLPPDGRHTPVIPWDALHGAGGPAGRFPRPELLAGHGLHPREWPPAAALHYLKDLSHRAGEPVSLYRCETWGGDVEFEAAWLPGWAPGEPDRVIAWVGGRIATAVGSRVREEEGDVLQRLLEFHRLRLPGRYFAPHTGTFAWERHRVRPREPVPKDVPGPDRPARPRPPAPRSMFGCVELGDAEGAARLLAAGCDLNAYAEETPLSRAAALGRADLVDMLVQSGAGPGREGRTEALRRAADVACAALLVAAGAEIEPPGPRRSPLAEAAAEEHEEVARWLVERGASERPTGREASVLLAGCSGDLAWLVERALAAGVPLETREYGDSGRTALALAAAEGSAAVVRLLLGRGAELSEETWFAACSGGILELVEAHLERGQDVAAVAHGWDGLALAAREDRGEVVRRLLAAGADPGRVCFDQSILYIAAWAGSLAAVEALLERLPAEAVDARGRMDWTPLFAAVWRGRQDIVTRLLAAGADPEIVDEHGRSLRKEAELRGVSLTR